MREITIAGAGTSHPTPEVMNALKNSDVIFASPRFMHLIPAGKKIIDIKNYSQFENESGRILFLVSGDPGIFSLLPLIKRKCQNVKVLPGISSLQVIASYAAETWHNAAILSGHGRNINAGHFLNTVERNAKTILFCDSNISPSWACEKLLCLPSVEVFIGCNFGEKNELFLHGHPKEFIYRSFPELSIILIKNNAVYSPEKIFLRDRDFLREKNIVMTNEAVRSVILSRLAVNNNSVLWDIGAGSGSISVCSAHEFPYSDVHAVEHSHEAADLIIRNAAKFHLHNIHVHESRALSVVGELPAPSHVFIGGSDGELPGLLEYISRFHVRVVIACVTLETTNTAYNLLHTWENFEAVQIAVTSSHPLNSSLTLMKANNPVMIFTAEK